MPSGIKRYDVYRKAIDGLQVKTSIGGLISIISVIIVVCLISMQTYHFIVPVTRTTLTVESQMDKVIPSVLNISFLQLPCESVDLHFESTKSNPSTNIITTKNNIYSSDGVKGCQVYSTFDLHPGEGNFHVALSSRFFPLGASHFFDRQDLESFNCSHIVHELRFGEMKVDNTLDNYEENVNTPFNHVTYFLKLLPVEYISLHGRHTHGYEYSVTEYTELLNKPSFFSRTPPGVFFKYQVSPIRLTKNKSRTGFLQYYTTLCSIVGGVITVSGIIQSLLTHTVLPAKLD